MAKMEMGLGHARCAANNCTASSVVILAGLDFCLEHFVVKCYERLDLIEPLVRNHRLGPEAAKSAGTLLQECANQTLLVCLRHQPLNNLERSRLLEILLQCGDLQVLLHRPVLQLT
jgi:hypothetical protein